MKCQIEGFQCQSARFWAGDVFKLSFIGDPYDEASRKNTRPYVAAETITAVTE